MAEFAQDVAELLDHLGIHKAIIIGHSMGGIVALNLGYLRPDIVQGLVIEDSPMPPPNQANNQATEAEKNSPLADNADYNSVERPMILGELMRPNPDWFVNLAEMKMPTLVIGGGDLSLYVNQSQLISLAEKLTNGKFIEIPVGHNIHQDAPDIFSSAVSKFAITNNLST
jgi:pimeloyl-ACP methyl ester carboxylesterase